MPHRNAGSHCPGRKDWFLYSTKTRVTLPLETRKKPPPPALPLTICHLACSQTEPLFLHFKGAIIPLTFKLGPTIHSAWSTFFRLGAPLCFCYTCKPPPGRDPPVW